MATLKEDSHSWRSSGIVRRDFRNGYHPEDEDEVRPRSKGKGKRHCKRSKDGVHDFSKKMQGVAHGRKVVTTKSEDGTFRAESVWGYYETTYIVCAKCGKPQNYAWRYGNLF